MSGVEKSPYTIRILDGPRAISRFSKGWGSNSALNHIYGFDVKKTFNRVIGRVNRRQVG